MSLGAFLPLLREYSPHLAGLFPQQRRAVSKGPRFRTWLAPRRSGKTFLSCSWLLGGPAGQMSIYGAPTLKSAKNNIMGTFAEMSERWGLNLSISTATGTIVEPSGHRVQLYGLHSRADIDLIRGLRKVRRVLLDECGALSVPQRDGDESNDNLKYAVESVFQPMLIDVKGELCATGTPGRFKAGYFYRLTGNPGASPPSAGAWPCSHWELRDNPHVDGLELEEQVLAANGWTRDHPTFLREYRAIWADDTESIVYDYQGPRFAEVNTNGVTALVVDFGHVDRTAFLVGRQDISQGPELRLIDAYARGGMSLGEIAAKITQLMRQHRVNLVYADEGALGKTLAESLRRQYGLPIEPAPKRNKRGRIDNVRGRLTSKTLLVCQAAAAILDEWAILSWNETRDDHHESHVDDLSDCCAYMCALEVFTQLDLYVPPAPEESEDERQFRLARERAARRQGRLT